MPPAQSLKHCCCSHSMLHVCAQRCLTLCDPTDCRSPGSSVHGIFQVRNWSGLPLPSPGDLRDSRIEPTSLRLLHGQVECLPLVPPGKRWDRISVMEMTDHTAYPGLRWSWSPERTPRVHPRPGPQHSERRWSQSIPSGQEAVLSAVERQGPGCISSLNSASAGS